MDILHDGAKLLNRIPDFFIPSSRYTIVRQYAMPELFCSKQAGTPAEVNNRVRSMSNTLHRPQPVLSGSRICPNDCSSGRSGFHFHHPEILLFQTSDEIHAGSHLIGLFSGGINVIPCGILVIGCKIQFFRKLIIICFIIKSHHVMGNLLMRCNLTNQINLKILKIHYQIWAEPFKVQ